MADSPRMDPREKAACQDKTMVPLTSVENIEVGIADAPVGQHTDGVAVGTNHMAAYRLAVLEETRIVNENNIDGLNENKAQIRRPSILESLSSKRNEDIVSVKAAYCQNVRNKQKFLFFL